jgi:hypothetical protein
MRVSWALQVFDHLLILYKFAITVLIIVAMSLDIVYHILYILHLKLNVVIGEPKYICLIHIVMIFFDTGRDLCHTPF